MENNIRTQKEIFTTIDSFIRLEKERYYATVKGDRLHKLQNIRTKTYGIIKFLELLGYSFEDMEIYLDNLIEWYNKETIIASNKK